MFLNFQKEQIWLFMDTREGAELDKGVHGTSGRKKELRPTEKAQPLELST
jgi:hypothetical protein